MVVRSNCSVSPRDWIRNPPLSITRAVVASVSVISSPSMTLNCWTSSSMSCGSVAMRLDMSRRLSGTLADELVEQHAGDHVERFEYSFALVSDRSERRDLNFAIVQKKLHVVGRSDIGQILFVVLENIGNVREVQLEGLEVFFQVVEALHVLGHFFVLGIGDKHDPIHAAEHKLPRGVVDDLAGDGVKLELGLETFDRHRLDGQEVEEQRAVGTGGERDELAFVAGGGLNVVVDLHEVGGLAAHGGTVVNDLDLQFLGCLVYNGHNSVYFAFRSNSAAMAASCAVGNACPATPNAAK